MDLKLGEYIVTTAALTDVSSSAHLLTGKPVFASFLDAEIKKEKEMLAQKQSQVRVLA